jgi:hypothetical protein
MLYGANLSLVFWGQAVLTACYILNYRISKGDESLNKSPFEIWNGKNPSVKHLRVFGCDCFVHIPSSKRSKLESKSIKLNVYF